MKKWRLDTLLKKAEREGVSMSAIGRRGGLRKAKLYKKKYVSKPLPETPYWDL
jgi:hypothetical protein